jgi:hypothetical protein
VIDDMRGGFLHIATHRQSIGAIAAKPFFLTATMVVIY